MLDFSIEIKNEARWRQLQPIQDIFFQKILKSKNVDSAPREFFHNIYHFGGFFEKHKNIEVIKEFYNEQKFNYSKRELIDKGFVANLAKTGSKSILLSLFPTTSQGIGEFLKEENRILFFRHVLPQHSMYINFYIEKNINSSFLQKDLTPENHYLLQYQILDISTNHSVNACVFNIRVILEKSLIALSHYGISLDEEGFFKKL